MLRDSAWQKIREYIKRARQDGMTWRQIGEALNLATVVEERSVGLAEAAFDYAADAEHARQFETLSFAWTCRPAAGLSWTEDRAAATPKTTNPGTRQAVLSSPPL